MRAPVRCFLVVFALFVGAHCSPEKKGEAASSDAASKLPVEVVTLREESLREGSEYLAQLVCRHQVALYPQVVGVVSEILAKPGDVVKQGAMLLKIDARRDAATLAQLLAAKSQQEASVALARSVEQRSAQLLNQGLYAQAQYEQDKSALAVAEHDLRAREAAIDAQSVQLAYFRITAPFAGVVGDIPVKLGDFVVSTTKLTSVSDNDRLEVYVNVPVEKLSLLGESSIIEVLDGVGKKLAEGPIVFVASEASAQAQAVLVKAVIPNDKSFRAGQVVRSRVVFRAHKGVRVPLISVVRQSGQYFVFVVATDPKDGKQSIVQQRAVELGELDDNLYAVVKGLVAGDRVVVTQLQKLHDGGGVEATEQSEKPASSSSTAPSASSSTSPRSSH